MKKLLFLLFPVFSYGQITVNSAFSPPQSSTTDASAFGITSATLTAGRLYLFISTTTGTTNAGTLTTTTTTWDNVINTGNSTRRIQVFRFMPTSTVTGESVSLGTFGGGSTGFFVTVLEITGVPLGANGANALIQSTSGGATGADPTLTLSALDNNRSAVISFFINDRNGFAGTEESGWTEDYDGGYTTPDAGNYMMRRMNTTDNTPTVTSASSTWIGVAFELKASGRRATVIN